MPEAEVDDEVLRTLRAAVEAVVPVVDGVPGAAEVGVERHVARSLELYVSGFSQLLASILDAFAADVRRGVPFAELSVQERQEVIRLICLEESADLQDLVDAFLVFTYGGHYSEWTGYDRASGRLEPPASWAQVGYAGPVDGHPRYRDGR